MAGARFDIVADPLDAAVRHREMYAARMLADRLENDGLELDGDVLVVRAGQPWFVIDDLMQQFGTRAAGEDVLLNESVIAVQGIELGVVQRDGLDERPPAGIQALAEKLDDRFTLLYQSGTSEILHDSVEIWLDLPAGTDDFERIELVHPRPGEEREGPVPEELYTSFAAWWDNGMLPMFFKPTPEKQWRRALQKALRLQTKLKAEGRL